MKSKNIFLAVLLCSVIGNSVLFSYAPTNFFRSYEYDYRPVVNKNNRFRFGIGAEYGQTSKSRDWDENKRNVLQRYNPKESSVAMLLGAPTGSKIDKLAKELGVSAATITADDCRGKFDLTGEYRGIDLVAFGKYKLPIDLEGTFELGLFIPFKSLRFSNVKWVDQTKDVLTADKKFKDEISGQLATKALELGCLDIAQNGWKKDGLGDIAIMLNWKKRFKQNKEYLQSVCVNAQVGLTIPTGAKKDIDNSLSLPLGCDGGWGIPASLGLDLNFVQHIRTGIELSIHGVFDTTNTYRMKTSTHQTDYLLLHKGQATRSQGMAWKFTLYAQAKKIIKGLSGTVSYHFFKHDEDRINPKSYDFNHSIVNSAESLKEWNSHSFVFELSYKMFGKKSKAKVAPHVSLFYKLPITGKRVILANTFGGQIGFSF